MSTLAVREGEILHASLEIDFLLKHARKPNKVTEVNVFHYTNGIAALYVDYADKTIARFVGNNLNDLVEWAGQRRDWPKCRIRNISIPYPVIPDDPEPLPTPANRVARQRKGRKTEIVEEVVEEAVEEVETVLVKRVRRTRS